MRHGRWKVLNSDTAPCDHCSRCSPVQRLPLRVSLDVPRPRLQFVVLLPGRARHRPSHGRQVARCSRAAILCAAINNPERPRSSPYNARRAAPHTVARSYRPTLHERRWLCICFTFTTPSLHLDTCIVPLASTEQDPRRPPCSGLSGPRTDSPSTRARRGPVASSEIVRQRK